MAKYNYDKSLLKGLSHRAVPAPGEDAQRGHSRRAGHHTQLRFQRQRARQAPAPGGAALRHRLRHRPRRRQELRAHAGRGERAPRSWPSSAPASTSPSALNIDGALVHKPYTIRSNPADALGTENTSYTLTIKRTNPAYASAYILDNWKQGDKVDISGPLGDFYYQGLRDAKHVVALAGGSGITPFYSMAAAIVSGLEDFDLTILYGSRTADGILLKDEIEELAAKSGGRVKVVHVLSDEEREGYEHGFVTAELIKKYAGDGRLQRPHVRPEGDVHLLRGRVQKARAAQAPLPRGDERRLHGRREQRRLPQGADRPRVQPHRAHTRRDDQAHLQGRREPALGDGARGASTRPATAAAASAAGATPGS